MAARTCPGTETKYADAVEAMTANMATAVNAETTGPQIFATLTSGELQFSNMETATRPISPTTNANST